MTIREGRSFGGIYCTHILKEVAGRGGRLKNELSKRGHIIPLSECYFPLFSHFCYFIQNSSIT
jgi:hypothetical protein